MSTSENEATVRRWNRGVAASPIERAWGARGPSALAVLFEENPRERGCARR